MEPMTLVGLAAALCTTAAFVPQVVQILKTGNVDGISMSMYSIFTLGVALWLVYAVVIGDLPMLMANLVTLILAATVLALTIRVRIFPPEGAYVATDLSSQEAPADEVLTAA